MCLLAIEEARLPLVVDAQVKRNPTVAFVIAGLRGVMEVWVFWCASGSVRQLFEASGMTRWLQEVEGSSDDCSLWFFLLCSLVYVFSFSFLWLFVARVVVLCLEELWSLMAAKTIGEEKLDGLR